MMKKIFLTLSVLVLTACSGTDFKKLDDSQLNFNVETPSSIKAKLGKPNTESEMTRNNKVVKALNYTYAHAYGKGTDSNVVPVRNQTFYFYEDKLVGNQYLSSWDVDSTDFDESKISQITEGKSTLFDVISLMGEPSGYEEYPLIASEKLKNKVYQYMQMTSKGLVIKKFAIYNKILKISYDTNNIVTKVSYEANGAK